MCGDDYSNIKSLAMVKKSVVIVAFIIIFIKTV